jgi:hypothetical protein
VAELQRNSWAGQARKDTIFFVLNHTTLQDVFRPVLIVLRHGCVNVVPIQERANDQLLVPEDLLQLQLCCWRPAVFKLFCLFNEMKRNSLLHFREKSLFSFQYKIDSSLTDLAHSCCNL